MINNMWYNDLKSQWILDIYKICKHKKDQNWSFISKLKMFELHNDSSMNEPVNILDDLSTLFLQIYSVCGCPVLLLIRLWYF